MRPSDRRARMPFFDSLICWHRAVYSRIISSKECAGWRRCTKMEFLGFWRMKCKKMIGCGVYVSVIAASLLLTMNLHMLFLQGTWEDDPVHCPDCPLDHQGCVWSVSRGCSTGNAAKLGPRIRALASAVPCDPLPWHKPGTRRNVERASGPQEEEEPRLSVYCHVL